MEIDTSRELFVFAMAVLCSTVMNEGVNMQRKAVTANLFTVVGLLVEHSTAIAKKKEFS